MTPDLYSRSGFDPPWTGYIALCEAVVVGTCAFKSAPCDDRLEIAYYTMPSHEGRGIATAMAQELIEVARSERPEITVTAQTLPEENASTAILRKLGFAHAGILHTVEDGDVWEWHLHPGFRLR